ncbi:MAG: hypothetical protein IT204_14645 [Fimbriimonadaceae bacterium]|nr:hypothetical protein [Fimbriimonadaceae bacterium]
MRLVWQAGLPLMLLLAVAGSQTGAAPAAYVGTAVCLRCHIDYARQWAALDHSKAMAAERLPPEKRGCEACHGPGGAHSFGQRQQIVRWRTLPPPEANGVCLACHQEQVPAALWRAGPHDQKVSCDQCHAVHRKSERDKLLRRPEGQDCQPCHQTLAAEAAAKRHHTLADGALTCDMCHAFHGSREPHLLKLPQAAGCGECHGEDVPQPESHGRAGFKLKHGGDAKGHQDECRMCHDQVSFCDTCHAVPLPHPPDFATEHKEACQKQPASCLKCHDEAYCKLCHEAVPAPVGKAAP